MKLNLLIIVCLTLLSYSLNVYSKETPDVPSHTVDSMVVLPVPTSPRPSDSGDEVYEEGVLQVVPSEDSGSDSSTEDATGSEGEDDGSEETPEEVGHVERAWASIRASFNSTVQRGYDYKEKVMYSRKMGEINGEPVNLLVIKKAEAAIQQADEVRDQRALEKQIELDKQAILNDKTLMCLTLNGWYEARNQDAIGEVGTAADVLNRLSVGYRGATTVCDVVTSPAQFSWVKEYGMEIPDFANDQEEKAWERSILIAKRMVDPDAVYIDPTKGATMYHNPKISTPNWSKDYRDTATLGDHLFQGEKDPNHKYYIDVSTPRLNPILFNGLSHTERNAMKKAFQLKKRV